MKNYPDLPPDSEFSRAVRNGVLLPLVMMSLLALLLSWLVGHLFDVAGWVDRTDQAIGRAYACEKLVIDMETGLRGYQVTGDREFLQPLTQARAVLDSELAQFAQDLAEEARVKRINSLLQGWEEFASNMIDRRERGANYQEIPSNLQGKGLMDAIRREFAKFQEEASALRGTRVRDLEELKRFILGARWVLALVYALVLGWFVRRQLLQLAAHYRQAIATAVQKNEALEESQTELRDQHERYKVTLSSIGDAVIATDAQGKVTFLNPLAETLTGWKSSEGVGQPLESVFKIVNEQTHQPAENPLFKVLREGNVVGLANHTALISKQGIETSIEDSAAPIKDIRGQVVGAVMVFHDVTERRRLEQRLAQSEAHHRCIAELTSDFTFSAHVTREKAIIVKTASAGFSKTTGYTVERLNHIGGWQALVHPPDLPVARASTEVLLDGQEDTREIRLRRPDGEVRWVRYHVRPERDVAAQGLIIHGAGEDITERKHAEELRVRLASVIEFSDDAIISKTLEGIITTWNKGAEQIFGYSAGEAVGQSIFILIPPGRLDEEKKILERIQHGERIVHYETVRCRKDGSLLDVSLTVSPMIDTSGRMIGASKIARDITDRKRAEEALRQSQSVEKVRRMELESLIEAAPAIVWIAHDPACRQITGNPAAAAFMRVPSGRNQSKTGPEGERLAHVRVFHEGRLLSDDELPMQVVARTGQPRRAIELEERFSDGSTAWLFGSVVPLWHEDGRLRGSMGVFVEITARKEAEEALRTSEIRLRRLFDYSRAVMNNLTEGLYTLDTSGLVTYVNPAAESLFGWTSAELLGQKIHDATHYHHPDGAPCAACDGISSQVLEIGIPLCEHEAVYRRKDGSLFPVVFSAAPLTTDGQPLGIVVAFRDDTERRRTKSELDQAFQALKEAKDQLTRHAADLERDVARRTAELREVNSQLEEYIYSIAHDLRHPVRAMEGFSEILLENHASVLSASGQEYLQQINRSAQFMDKLLLDLLAYGRTARAPLELRSVPVQRVWEVAQLQCSQTIQQTGARIETIHPLPCVLAHETSLSQILINLLSNALKFGAPGVTAQIKFSAAERNGVVRLSVEDNGIGIALEHQERIFRVFERLAGTRYEGTGIGLAIVRKGAERMGGRAGVESEPGRGSRFWVDLPKG